MILIRICSIDQATKLTGWSVWDNNKLFKYGILKSNINENNPIERMCIMMTHIAELLDELKPDYVCLEGVQFQRNFSTYSQLSQLQGVLFTLLFERDIPFTVIEPSAWKSFCGVKGKNRVEQKANTIRMVANEFGLEVSEDEADAIGIGLWAINKIKHEGDKSFNG